MLVTLILTATALAQDPWEWASPNGDEYPNAVVADLDGDGKTDLAIGTAERCGGIDVWLSTVDPRIELVDEIWLDAPTWHVAPDDCDPVFGTELAAHDGMLGTSPGADGLPTATVTFEGRPVLTLAGTPEPSGAQTACEPCCGPAPCCLPGAGGGGGHGDLGIVVVGMGHQVKSP